MVTSAHRVGPAASALLKRKSPAVSFQQPVQVPGEDELILVDEANRMVGSGGKLAVHEQGQLHRAFSIFLFDAAGRVLLQRRSLSKYHSGGLWANTCCGHPRLGERTLAAAHRRLGEELGMTARLTYGFQARYSTSLDHGLTENELVYVYVGRVTGTMVPDPAEVCDTRLMSLADLIDDTGRRPQDYAYWLRHYLLRHAEVLGRLSLSHS
jgi:isopentenyl-diphosphate Delta-isomerase